MPFDGFSRLASDASASEKADLFANRVAVLAGWGHNDPAGDIMILT
jgi:hypothetical protein